jgi:hypothetical protein
MVGACRDWYCTQHHVTLSDEKHTVVWATPDAPLISIQDINTGKWLEKLEIENGFLFSYVMNNYWYTNYKASQKGCKVRYSITTHSGTVENSEAVHFGWGRSNQLLTFSLPTSQKGKLKGKHQSFCSVDKPNAIVLALKLSEDKKGWVVRLLEIEGKAGKATLRLSFKFERAYLCNLIEEEKAPLQVKEGKVKVPLREHGIVTIKLCPP